MCIDGASLEELCSAENLYGSWQDFYLRMQRLCSDGQLMGRRRANRRVQRLSKSPPLAKVLNSIFLINYACPDELCVAMALTRGLHEFRPRSRQQIHGPFYQRFIEYDGSANACTKTAGIRGKRQTNYIVRFSIPARRITRRAPELERCYINRWHHWQYKRIASMGNHPQCGSPAHDCDYYYFSHK